MPRRMHRIFSVHHTYCADHSDVAATAVGFPRPRHEGPNNRDDDGFPQHINRPRTKYIQHRGAGGCIAQISIVGADEYVDAEHGTGPEQGCRVGEAISSPGRAVAETPHEDNRHKAGCDVKKPVHQELEYRVIEIVEIRGNDGLQIEC